MNPGSFVWLYIVPPESIKLWKTVKPWRSTKIPMNNVSPCFETDYLDVQLEHYAENALHSTYWLILLSCLHYIVHQTKLSINCTLLTFFITIWFLSKNLSAWEIISFSLLSPTKSNLWCMGMMPCPGQKTSTNLDFYLARKTIFSILWLNLNSSMLIQWEKYFFSILWINFNFICKPCL